MIPLQRGGNSTWADSLTIPLPNPVQLGLRKWSAIEPGHYTSDLTSERSRCCADQLRPPSVSVSVSFEGRPYAGRTSELVAQITHQPLDHALTSRHGATDDEHRVVTSDRARNVGPLQLIERLRHRLRAGLHRARHHQHLHTLD